MKERIETLERLIPKFKASKKILPLKVECLEWELRALKAEAKNSALSENKEKQECSCFGGCSSVVLDKSKFYCKDD